MAAALVRQAQGRGAAALRPSVATCAVGQPLPRPGLEDLDKVVKNRWGRGVCQSTLMYSSWEHQVLLDRDMLSAWALSVLCASAPATYLSRAVPQNCWRLLLLPITPACRGACATLLELEGPPHPFQCINSYAVGTSPGCCRRRHLEGTGTGCLLFQSGLRS